MTTRTLAMLAIAMFLPLSPATSQVAGPQVPNDVRADIAAIITDEVAAWDRGDAVAFAAHAIDDVAFTNIVGMSTVGRAAFLAQHAHIFSTVYKGSTMTQEIVHIALVRPDVAVVDTLAGVRGFGGLPPGVEAEDGTLRTRLEQVMVRNDGSWRVAAFHNVVVNARALAISR